MESGGETHRQDKSATLKVEGAIDGASCLMTVDTGAERTIVHPEMIRGRELGDNSRKLCGITGHCVPLRGPVNVTIGLKGQQVIWPVYVSEVQDDCLLGLDLLRAVGALVDLEKGILKVVGVELPLIYTEALAEVVVTREVTLPPCSETRVLCHLSRVMKGSTGMLEASEVTDNVMVARSLITREEDKIMVLMANFSQEERRVHAGTKVGVCEEVEVQGKRQESLKVAAPGRSFPAHLSDLTERSAKYLSAD